MTTLQKYQMQMLLRSRCWIWCWTFIVILLVIPNFVASLKDVSVTIPQAVKRGNNALLICNYDMENDTLYSVKWYKGRREFYRYTPKENPAMKVFTVTSGLNVDRNLSNQSHVVIVAVQLNISGKFTCEISVEAPSFQTAMVSGELEVVELPIEQATVTGIQPRYRIGDLVDGNCSIKYSKPAANLTWTINGIVVPPHHIKAYQTEKHDNSYMESVMSEIHFMVTTQHFINGQMKLKCTASIFDIFKEEIETLIEEDRPRIMASGRSYDMNGYGYNHQGSGDGYEDHNESYLTYFSATSSAEKSAKPFIEIFKIIFKSPIVKLNDMKKFFMKFFSIIMYENSINENILESVTSINQVRNINDKSSVMKWQQLSSAAVVLLLAKNFLNLKEENSQKVKKKYKKIKKNILSFFINVFPTKAIHFPTAIITFSSEEIEREEAKTKVVVAVSVSSSNLVMRSPLNPVAVIDGSISASTVTTVAFSFSFRLLSYHHGISTHNKKQMYRKSFYNFSHIENYGTELIKTISAAKVHFLFENNHSKIFKNRKDSNTNDINTIDAITFASTRSDISCFLPINIVLSASANIAAVCHQQYPHHHDEEESKLIAEENVGTENDTDAQAKEPSRTSVFYENETYKATPSSLSGRTISTPVKTSAMTTSYNFSKCNFAKYLSKDQILLMTFSSPFLPFYTTAIAILFTKMCILMPKPLPTTIVMLLALEFPMTMSFSVATLIMVMMTMMMMLMPIMMMMGMTMILRC